MNDGAHMGIKASRALDTIIGGKEQPTEEEKATPKGVRARIEAVPLFEGKPPWEGIMPGGEDKEARDNAYSTATDAIAHAFLVLIEEDSSLLEPQFYPAHYPDGEPTHLAGVRRDQASVLWDAMMKRWPHADDWIGGASGFMVGFALNTALYAGEIPAYASNPAIMEIDV